MFRFLKNRYFWIMFVVIVVSLIAVNQTSAERDDLTIAEEMVRKAYTPLQRGVSIFRGHLKNLELFFVGKQKLMAEVKRLEEELAALQLENQGLREYRYESRRLKELLEFRDHNLTNMRMIPAQVIARNPNTWYSTVTIDQGSDKGISRNMPVITPKGLVGRVTSVSSDHAVVTLISDREAAVGAMVQETRVPGIIVGTVNGKHLKLSQIPFYSEVHEGNRVVTSRFSELYPAGILIGTIAEIHTEAEALTKTATVIPAVDLDQIEEVLVVTNYINPAFEWGTLETGNPESVNEVPVP
ncbi:MAG: rod shape-determining protein MreC [Syntrophomonadaceae bacterium]|nr:rod shape-determining protein MreC [Syntrophomonadaceae bacterium]